MGALTGLAISVLSLSEKIMKFSARTNVLFYLLRFLLKYVEKTKADSHKMFNQP